MLEDKPNSKLIRRRHDESKLIVEIVAEQSSVETLSRREL